MAFLHYGAGPIWCRLHGYNGKIADISEADQANHTTDISAHVPANCVAVILGVRRISGTGQLYFYPIEGAGYVNYYGIPHYDATVTIINQRLEHSQSVANDDFDVIMFGYFTEG